MSEVVVHVGTEVAFYGKFDRTPRKVKIAKVHKNGRFLVEGCDEQFTPKSSWTPARGNSWSAVKSTPHSRYSMRVVPWTPEVDAAIDQEKKRRVYGQKLSMIKNYIEHNVRPQDEATIDNLFRLLGLNHEDLK